MAENKKSMNQWIITAVVAVVVAGGAFFGGMKYQQSKTPTFGGRQFGQGTGAGRFGGANGGARGTSGRPVVGSIISVDDKSLTVKMMDGSTKIVLLSDTTTYTKSGAGSKADLTTGNQVGVFGTDNSDGSVTAQSIQLNPQFGRGFGSGISPTPASSSAY